MTAVPNVTRLTGAAPNRATLLRRLGRTSLLAFGVQAGGVGVSYTANLLAARLAGPDNYGLYAFVVATMVIVAYVAALGYDSAMLRFVPAYMERSAPHLVVGVVGFVERRVTVMACAAVALGLLVVWARSAGQGASDVETYGLGLVLVPIWTLLLVRCAIVRAFGHALLALVSDRVLRDGGLLIVLALLALFHPFAVDAPVLMTATILSSLLAFAVATRFAARLCRACGAAGHDAQEAVLWRRAAYPFLALVVGEALINRCGIIMVGTVGHMADAGCLALIVNLAGLVMLPRLAVNAFLTPMIAAFYAKGDKAGLAEVVTRSSAWSFVAACAIGAGIWVASPMLLGWYGPSFLVGRGPLAVLIAGQIVATGGGAQLQLLKMTGRETGAAKVLSGSLATHVLLGLLLIPPLGLMGAALANLGCLVTWNVGMAPLVWRHLGIRPGISGWPSGR